MGEGQPLDEREKVAGWRFGEFLRMGFDADTAETLTSSDADLHRVESMLTDGCSFETAAAIAV